MSVLHFKAEEVLQMAERVEEAGIRFYRKGAEVQPGLRDLFLELAQMEEDHQRTFAEIRASLEEGGKAVTDEVTRAYLEAWADSHRALPILLVCSPSLRPSNFPSTITTMLWWPQ